MTQTKALPLHGVKVVDLCDRIGQGCGRLLADLGAEVILVEPLTGMQSRQRQPLYQGQSLHFAVRNANKKSVSLDLDSADGKQNFLALLDTTDLLLDGSEQGGMQRYGLSHDVLRRHNVNLLILSITDFGLQGPYKDFVGSEIVHSAMGALICRSGIAGREPLLPPGEMAQEAAAVQAAWVALLALWQRQFTGSGDLLDFSLNDCVAQILDPGVGATGSGAAGRTAVEVAEYGRPTVTEVPGKMPSLALLYPVFECADGHVRICVLNPRQWHAMSEWLGADHPFQDPKYAETRVRLMAIGKVNAIIAEHLKSFSRAELVAEGRKRGIPIASIAHSNEVLDDEHYRARGFYRPVSSLSDNAKMPAGYLRMDGQRIGARTDAPKLGHDNDALLNAAQSYFAGEAEGNIKSCGTEPITRKTLSDLVVLDLGVIVAGGELGRLFADQGANVIKLENEAFGDGLRTSFDGNRVPIPFMQGSRGKRSMGLNLRSEKGIEIFYDLVRKADVVLSNFKPGTTQALGIDYVTLKEINPRIICAESSAMGSVGPLAKTMGYGPLVRANTSLSWLWRYPDLETGFGDCITIYPDHFAARVSAAAILAKLIQREKTGVGGEVDVSQAECIMNVLAPEFLRESVEPGTMTAKGNRNEFDAPNSLFHCKGNDQWCAVSVNSDAQWQGLCQAMQRPDLARDEAYATAELRMRHQDKLEMLVSEWCKTRRNAEIMTLCQQQGVPAGQMLRLPEFLKNPHYHARGFFRKIYQPTVGRTLDTENAPVGFCETLPQPDIVRAPSMAEHTREIAKELLGLSDQDVDKLVASGDLKVGLPAEAGSIKQQFKTKLISTVVNVLMKYQWLKSKLA